MPSQTTADDRVGSKREQFRACDALTSTARSATRTRICRRLHPAGPAVIPP
jgi:hypothetical protein